MAVNVAERAQEVAVCDQVSELLQSRDLTCDELGLLYCYKHGASLNQALKKAGVDGNMQDFLRSYPKRFAMETGRVSVVRDDTPLKPFSLVQELTSLLESKGGKEQNMEVNALCAAFAQKFGVSVASVANCRPADLLERESSSFVLLGRSRVGLRRASTPKDQKVLVPAARAVAPSEGPKPLSPEDEERYRALHEKICSRACNSRVAQALSCVSEAVQSKCFLRVKEVIKGGSVGKSTAISGTKGVLPDAELVFVVDGLPTSKHDKWMPPLLRSVCSSLQQELSASDATSIQCTEDSVKLVAQGLVSVHLRFTPAFASYEDAVLALSRAEPKARRFFGPAFTSVRTAYVGKQAGWVKMTIRLVKWWVEQQKWSSARSRPSDELVEALCIYAAKVSASKLTGDDKPLQSQMVANVMALMSRFQSLRVVFEDVYEREDIWGPLLIQRPLLMDVANPYVNLGDAKVFDARELVSRASTTRFFW